MLYRNNTPQTDPMSLYILGVGGTHAYSAMEYHNRDTSSRAFPRRDATVL